MIFLRIILYKLLKILKQGNIKIFRNNKNFGLPKSINKAIRIANLSNSLLILSDDYD